MIDPGPAPAISVVIPSLNGAGRLPETLGAIANQTVGAPVEVIVVDDGSSDPTARLAASAPMPWNAVVVVGHETPRGRAAACNAGIRAAHAPTIVILDDDMTLDAGALEAHLRFHRENPRRAALGRIVQSGDPGADCFARFLAREEANRERQLEAARDDVPFALALTGHFSAPRALLLEAGGYDERIRRYGYEDIELAFRLTQRGVRIVYLPQAGALHRAFMTDLDKYLERHVEVGAVARELAGRYPDGPFRDYLRVDGPRSLGLDRVSAGLVGLRAVNRLLLTGWVRRALGSRAGMGALRAMLRGAAIVRFDRLAHFGYHVARDVHYFQGYFGEGPVAPHG